MSCRHDSTTIVEDQRDNVGVFLNTQCDVCGMCLPKAPIPEATFYAWYDGALRVPAVDRDALKAAIDAACAGSGGSDGNVQDGVFKDGAALEDSAR